MQKILAVVLVVLIIIAALPTAVPAYAADTVKVFGADDNTATAIFPADTFGLDRWIASSSGTVSEIRVKAAASGNIKVALYSDDGSGTPFELIDRINTVTSLTTGWNTIAFSETTVSAGTFYWLAYITDVPCLATVTTGGISRYQTYSGIFRTFNFPNTPSGTFTISAAYSLCAAWGTADAAVLPVVINSPGGASNITATSATLNGILTSADGNTNVRIYWGSTDGGTETSLWEHNENLGVISTGTFSRTISGLVENETYYYRCMAYNTSGTDYWADSSSFLAHDPRKLFGANDQTGISTMPGDTLVLDKWTMPEGATNIAATQIRAKCLASANIKVALYSDNNGKPGTLLANAANAVPVVAGWNIINLPTTSINAGTDYWIAFISDNASVISITNYASADQRYESASYSNFSFPNSPGSGFTTNTNQYSLIAVWGMVTTTSVPEVINTPSGASDITATSATLNGILTSTGGSETTVYIFWGDNDGGTTPTAWDYDINLGARSVGPFFAAISELVNGTTYYYRCYASNTSGSSWAATSSVFLTHNPVKLFGADDQTGGGTLPADCFILDKWILPARGISGIKTQVRVKCETDADIKIALYNDNNGEPGTLITAINDPIAVTAGWNIINIAATTVSAGNNYWIAFITDSDSVNCVVNYSLTDQRYKFASYDDFTFPGEAGTGFTSDTNQYSLTAVWGIVVINAPVVNNTTGASNISATSARLNGALIATGGATTTVKVHWGDNDGGTTASAWDNSVDLGTMSPGSFSLDISGLTEGKTYYYRCSATNSTATTWSDATSFTTLAAILIPELIPDDGSNTIATDALVQVVFNQVMTPYNLSGIAISPDPGNVRALLSSDGLTLNITHDDFDNGTTYTVTVPAAAVKNNDDMGNAAVNWSFTTVLAAPTALLTPTQGATNIKVNTIITTTFNQMVTANDFSSITLAPAAANVAAALSGDGMTMAITHDDLDYNTTYTVTIPADAVLNTNNIGNEQISWSFTTVIPPAPSAVVYPLADSTSVAVDTTITATFDQEITGVDLSIVNLSPDPGGLAVSINSNGITLDIAHNALAYDMTYTVTIPAGAVSNNNGILNEEITWNFATLPEMSPDLAHTLKINTISRLEDSFTGAKNVDNKIRNAITNINDSLSPGLWIDETHLVSTHGITVFHKEKVAAEALDNLTEKTGNAVFDEVIADLVQADMVLAQTAITKAGNTPVGNSNWVKKVAQEIAQAQSEYEHALQDNARGNYTKAITGFGQAWHHADLALKFALMNYP